MTQGHFLDKVKEKNIYDPQSAAGEKATEEKRKAKGPEKKNKPETKGPNAGIGMQVSLEASGSNIG
jgi:hypothetical protein